MTTPFNIVREALNRAIHELRGITPTQDMAEALTALARIEADHFTAADMASAAAQGFRDGGASVQQGEPVGTFWQHPKTKEWYQQHDGEPLYRAAPVAQPQAEAVPSDVVRDAERYRQVRRGQKWFVIDGTGSDLKSETLDAAIDAAIAQGAKP